MAASTPRDAHPAAGVGCAASVRGGSSATGLARSRADVANVADDDRCWRAPATPGGSAASGWPGDGRVHDAALQRTCAFWQFVVSGTSLGDFVAATLGNELTELGPGGTTLAFSARCCAEFAPLFFDHRRKARA